MSSQLRTRRLLPGRGESVRGQSVSRLRAWCLDWGRPWWRWSPRPRPLEHVPDGPGWGPMLPRETCARVFRGELVCNEFVRESPGDPVCAGPLSDRTVGPCEEPPLWLREELGPRSDALENDERGEPLLLARGRPCEVEGWGPLSRLWELLLLLQWGEPFLDWLFGGLEVLLLVRSPLLPPLPLLGSRWTSTATSVL